ATSTLLGEALLGRLALACGVVWPVFGLGRQAPALQRLPALASGAHLWPLAPLAHGTRAGLLATALHVNSSHRGRHRTRQSAASVQCEAVGVSSIWMPAAASSSRMRSAAAKSLFLRA